MTKLQITETEIRQLQNEAFAAGDAMQGYIAARALGVRYSRRTLAEDTCLSPAEQLELLGHTKRSARQACAAAIRDARGQS